MKSIWFRTLAATALLTLSLGCSSEQETPPPQPEFPEVKVDITEVTVGYLRTTAEPNIKVSRYALILAAQNIWEMQLETHGTEAATVEYLMENDPACIYTETVERLLIPLNGSLDFDYWLVCAVMDESGALYSIEKLPVRSPSYTENAPEATMTIEVGELTPTTARLIHTPDANTVGYYTLIYTRERYEEMLNTARTDPSIAEIYPNPEDYVVYFLRWEGWRWFEREDNIWQELTPGTEYMAVGAPFNVNGFEQGVGSSLADRAWSRESAVFRAAAGGLDLDRSEHGKTQAGGPPRMESRPSTFRKETGEGHLTASGCFSPKASRSSCSLRSRSRSVGASPSRTMWWMLRSKLRSQGSQGCCLFSCLFIRSLFWWLTP